jgi:hypothetical protein
MIDHLAGVLYNEDSQTVNNLMANGRTCESLPGVITSYYDECFLSEIETLIVLTHPGQTYALQFLSQCVLFQIYSPKGVPLR